MDIKDRIKKISPYFKEMQIVTLDGSQVIYVIVSFPRGWIIDDDIEAKFNVTINEGTNMDEYYFCADIETGEEAIFNAIDYNVEKMKDAIERAQLLNTKIKELKEMFQDESISLARLKTLEFQFNEATETSLTNEEESNFILPKRGRKSKDDTPKESKEDNKEDKQ